MPLPTISVEQAKALIDRGAVLVDIRGPDEYAREHIAGALHYPLSELKPSIITAEHPAVIFHCRSGNRTAANASRLAAAAACDAYCLEGGIEAWKAAGLPVIKDVKQPIDIMRQVQITAGGLVLIGMLLGTLVSPPFYALSAFIGAGLLFAGITGWCGMAKLLACMPWNRRGLTIHDL